MRPTLCLLTALTLTVSALSQPAAPAPGAPGTPGVAAPAAPTAQPPARGGRAGGGRGGPNAPEPAGTPPLPFVLEHSLGGLRFDQPLGIVTAPGDTKRLFILEKSGRIILIPDLTKPEKVTFLDLSEEIGSLDIERGLLSLAFHPDYKRNRQFYVYFTVTKTITPAAAGQRAVEESYDRLARFTISATDPNKADRNSEQPIFSQIDRAANHNGGELFFGKDGYLYLSLADEVPPNDVYLNSQKIDDNFFSGVIRIDVDKKPGSLAPNPHPAIHPGTYTIPPDNPWVGATSFNTKPIADPKKVRTEFYAVGLRNPWRMHYDPITDLIWVADVGQESRDEIDLIRKGGNYGWNYREAEQPFVAAPQRGGSRGLPSTNTTRLPPDGTTFDEPIHSYGRDALGGQCIIGGFVYRSKTIPSLTDHYIFADYSSGNVWALSPVDGKGVAGKQVTYKDGQWVPNAVNGKVTVQRIARRAAGTGALGLNPLTGDILVAFVSTGGANSGYIDRLVPNPAATVTTSAAAR